MNNVTLVCNVSQFDYTSADDNNLYLEIDKMESVDNSSNQFIWLRDEEKICRISCDRCSGSRKSNSKGIKYITCSNDDYL